MLFGSGISLHAPRVDNPILAIQSVVRFVSCPLSMTTCAEMLIAVTLSAEMLADTSSRAEPTADRPAQGTGGVVHEGMQGDKGSGQ